VRRTRAELVETIETLAGLECWPPSLHDDVMTRATQGSRVRTFAALHYHDLAQS
jgi:hypothetical protein